MKKFYLLILLLFAKFGVHAQLDRQHWFAPMIDRVSSSQMTTTNAQRLYLSTNRTTPFPVSIYNNNVLIATITISKGNPQKFDVPRNMIITTRQADLFTPVNMGIHAEAEFPFYANLRISIFNHAELITSKGIPSTGTDFRVVVTPNPAAFPYLNFMTSILATEDNTTVTVSDYQPATAFSNGMTGAANPTLTFTLNKGQSYIIDGMPGTAANSENFIGAKISANKRVNVTNGNFNGQYLNISNSSDILMDQAVPVNQLGNIFALVKGNGNIGSQMEGAMVVATVNNTEVYLNNETAPSAVLNAGQYYKVPDSKYILQGSNHYNMYIRTTANAYVYQILAGTANPTYELATGGFNFIPALNCYLPKQIDELGLIDENQIWSTYLPPAGATSVPTRLNMITEAGATVTVNGTVPAPVHGPFPLTGAPNWVSYGIPDVTGNLTINSTKAITAGITAGSDVVGYGGFFAGFPTSPAILTSGGNCVPGTVLTADPQIYDTYQWFLNGTAIPGATSAVYTPTQSGEYSVSVTMGSCAPLIATAVKVQKCMVTSTASYFYCTALNINPVLSSPTFPQTVNPGTVTVVTAPINGTVSINPANGQITYTPNNPGVPGTDTFTYTFCGNHPDFPECETVTVNITIGTLVPINANIAPQFVCDTDLDGSATVDIAQYLPLFTTDPLVMGTFFATMADAQNNVNPLPNPHIITGTQTLYIRFEKNGFCPNTAPLTLTVRTAKKSDVLTDVIICKNDRTTLDAGPGFDSYLWSTGDTTQSISNVGIGNYWVDLTFNGCTYRQHVAVTEATIPTIVSIEIKNGVVTVTATGGNPPYEYSLDGISWQTSNIFQLTRGSYTMYVRDSKRCQVVEQQFDVIELINAMTPNEDGLNDSLNYSELLNKPDVSFRIYDRYGYEIFTGTKANRFIWDGKTIGGRPVTTGTYWYILEWRESRTNTIVHYHSWLLVKNRTQDYFKN